MKKFAIILCSLLLAASLTACGGDDPSTESDSLNASEHTTRPPLTSVEESSDQNSSDEPSVSTDSGTGDNQSSSKGDTETEKTYTENDFTAVNETVYVTATDLSYRTAPSSSAKVAGYLLCMESAKRIGYNEKWSKISYDGHVYYMYSRYLTTENITGNDFTMFDAAKVMYINTDQVSVRLYPSKSDFSTIMGYVVKNDTMLCVGTNQTWYKVLYKGKNDTEAQERYVHSSCLSENKIVDIETNAPYDLSDFTFYDIPKTVTVNADMLNVRQYPSADNKVSLIKGYVEKGQQLTCYGDNGDWCQIDFKGNKYYVRASLVLGLDNEKETESGYDLSDFTIYEIPVTMYINTSFLAIRQYPNANATILKYLEKGTAITCTGCDGTWYQISYDNGKVAYVSVKYVSVTKPAN